MVLPSLRWLRRYVLRSAAAMIVGGRRYAMCGWACRAIVGARGMACSVVREPESRRAEVLGQHW